MPSATDYTPTDRATLASANTERRQREQLHDRNWAYYAGQHRAPLRTEADDHDDNLVLNLCQQTIDRTIAFLVPGFPRLHLPARPADTQFLHDAWQQSGDAALLSNLALNGALNGHCVARVVQGVQGAQSVQGVQGGHGGRGAAPRVVSLNPRDVVTFWHADDATEVLWHELRWQDGRVQWRQDIVNEGQRWLIRELRMVGARWELQAEIIWPYALGPLVDWQHLPHPTQYYGQHELPHAPLNDAVNKVASDIARILRFHAFPRTIGTGFDAASVQRAGIDDFWTITNENAKVYNLEMQSDLGTSLRFLQLLTDAFLAQSRVTMLHGDPDSVKGVTNLAIRALYMDMIAKNEVLRRHYGGGLQALSQRLLLLGGRDASTPPDIYWGEALPTDRREQVELVARQLELGVLDAETAAAMLSPTGTTAAAATTTAAAKARPAPETEPR